MTAHQFIVQPWFNSKAFS